MVTLAFLIRLPTAAIGTVGAIIVLFHNLLDPISASRFGAFANAWKLVNPTSPGFLLYHDKAFMIPAHLSNASPWFGIMLPRMRLTGAIQSSAPAPRTLRESPFAWRPPCSLRPSFCSRFPALGYSATTFPVRSPRELPSRPRMSFFDLQKYPPSLQYVLATFSVLLLLFFMFDTIATLQPGCPASEPSFKAYGRVPLHYLLHVLHIYHTPHHRPGMDSHKPRRLALLGHTTNLRLARASSRPHWGYALPTAYAIWLAVVLALYFPCAWFNRLKARRHDWWLSYL